MNLKRLPLLCLTLLAWCPMLEAREPSRRPIHVETLLKTTTSWDGAKLPPYAEGQPEVTILRITVAPGTALPDHHHPYMNAGVLLKGQLEVKTANGDVKVLKAGEALAEVIGTAHFGRNTGDEPAEIIVVYAGIEGEPVTVLSHQGDHH